MPRLKDSYKAEIIPAMMQKFEYKNINQVPRLEKVVINMGLGEAKDNPKALDSAVEDLTVISGQKPVVTTAKKSVANFKVREGMKIGAKVTLRGDRMYEFIDKLISIAIPRVRDFRGLSPKSFDGRGNFAMGFKEQLVFPEIEYDKVDAIRGMDIIVVTTAQTEAAARELLTQMGMPFAHYGGKNGEKEHDHKAAERIQILYPQLYALPYLREAAFRIEKIWGLPCLLPGARVPRTDSGRQKSKLVRRRDGEKVSSYTITN